MSNVTKFGESDFEQFLTTREYLQARSLEETERIRTRIREVITMSVMYLLLVIGLFGSLFYSRHIEAEVGANSAAVATSRDVRNIAAEKNEPRSAATPTYC